MEIIDKYVDHVVKLKSVMRKLMYTDPYIS